MVSEVKWQDWCYRCSGYRTTLRTRMHTELRILSHKSIEVQLVRVLYVWVSMWYIIVIVFYLFLSGDNTRTAF